MIEQIPIADLIDAVAARLGATAEQVWAAIKSKAFYARLVLEGIDETGRRCLVEPHWIPYIEPWELGEPPSGAMSRERPAKSDMPRRDSGSILAFDRMRAIRDRREDARNGRAQRSVPPSRLRAIVAESAQIDTLWAREEHEFKGPDWSLGNVLSWIPFRDPVLICKFDSRRDLVAERRYDYPRSIPILRRQMLVPQADQVLLEALQVGRLTAIRNGIEIPSTYWFGKHTRDLTHDLRFRRSEVMTIDWWHTEPTETAKNPSTTPPSGQEGWNWRQAIVWAMWRDEELVELCDQNRLRFAERSAEHIRGGLRPAGGEQELRSLIRAGRIASCGQKDGINGREPIRPASWPKWAGMPKGWTEENITFDAGEIRRELPYVPETERPRELIQDPDWVVDKIDRCKLRLRQIQRFRDCQRRKRRWISFEEITDWCARESGSLRRDAALRTQAYSDLRDSILAGEFGSARSSRVLYLHPEPSPVEKRLRLEPAQLQM